MSSSDRSLPTGNTTKRSKTRSGRLTAAVAVGCALILSGCNVRPLYGPTALTDQSLGMTLSDVDVAPIKGRVGQKVRNDLLFLMNGGDGGGGTYMVNLQVDERYTNTITRTVSGLPGGRNIKLNVDYTLKKVGEPKVLTSGTVTRIASFDYFNQRFANDRATIDAENRAAREIAEEINIQVAAYFVTGQSFQRAARPASQLDEFPRSGDTIFDDQEPTYGGTNP